MIRPLRRRHPWMIGAVAVVAVPLYLAALAARPQRALLEAMPRGLEEPATADAAGFERVLETVAPIRVRSVDAGAAVELEAADPVETPDLLLYWVSGEGTPGALERAWLLGAFRGDGRAVFTLPEMAAVEPGSLVLYSLGHSQEVARLVWPGHGGGAP